MSTGRAVTRGFCASGARAGDGAEAAILEFVDYRFEAKEKAPRKESLSDRARRASGGRVETVRKEKPEGAEGDEKAEAAPKKPPKGGKSPRGEKKAAKASKQAPAKGPSRSGPSKRGA